MRTGADLGRERLHGIGGRAVLRGRQAARDHRVRRSPPCANGQLARRSTAHRRGGKNPATLERQPQMPALLAGRHLPARRGELPEPARRWRLRRGWFRRTGRRERWRRRRHPWRRGPWRRRGPSPLTGARRCPAPLRSRGWLLCWQTRGGVGRPAARGLARNGPLGSDVADLFVRGRADLHAGGAGHSGPRATDLFSVPRRLAVRNSDRHDSQERGTAPPAVPNRRERRRGLESGAPVHCHQDSKLQDDPPSQRGHSGRGSGPPEAIRRRLRDHRGRRVAAGYRRVSGSHLLRTFS